MTHERLSSRDREVIATLKADKDFAKLWAMTIELTDGDEHKALETLCKIVGLTNTARRGGMLRP